MYAVIETGGKQYLVKEGSVLSVEKLAGEKGQDIVFDKVLLLASPDGATVQIGTPYLPGVMVKAAVDAQTRAKKIRVVKYKRKVRYRRVRGHRQFQTRVKIRAIK